MEHYRRWGAVSIEPDANARGVSGDPAHHPPHAHYASIQVYASSDSSPITGDSYRLSEQQDGYASMLLLATVMQPMLPRIANECRLPGNTWCPISGISVDRISASKQVLQFLSMFWSAGAGVVPSRADFGAPRVAKHQEISRQRRHVISRLAYVTTSG
jgi:hypothetical protein